MVVPMVRLVVVILLLPFAAVAKDRGGDFDACRKGQIEAAKKAASFHGEERIKRLIEADIARAKKEEGEGDADECIEALDHAEKLIAGRY